MAFAKCRTVAWKSPTVRVRASKTFANRLSGRLRNEDRGGRRKLASLFFCAFCAGLAVREGGGFGWRRFGSRGDAETRREGRRWIFLGEGRPRMRLLTIGFAGAGPWREALSKPSSYSPRLRASARTKSTFGPFATAAFGRTPMCSREGAKARRGFAWGGVGRPLTGFCAAGP
jgi:hypothetical protein